MASTGVFRSSTIRVIDYRCEVQLDDAPFVELHNGFSISYVRKPALVTSPRKPVPLPLNP
jgi:AraC family transcriptional regulator